MIIKMLSTQKGSPNGIKIYEYVEGEVYPQPNVPLSDFLGNVFIDMGVAIRYENVEIEKEEPLEPPKKQAEKEAPKKKEKKTKKATTKTKKAAK
jgi:hypothetical protein